MAGRNRVLFVNYSHPDDARDERVRSEISRHVMEDIGRARRRRPRRPQVVPLEFRIDDPIEIPRNPEPVAATGVTIDSDGWELIRFTVTEAAYKYRPFRVVWNNLALREPSTINLTLANASVWKRQLTGQAGPSVENSSYYSNSVTQLNSRLRSAAAAERVSDSVVFAVMGLACHDSNVQDWERWALHVNGLASIIRLRGGLEGLGEGAAAYVTWVDVAANELIGRSPQIPLSTSIQDADLDHCVSPSLHGLLPYVRPEPALAMRRLAYVAARVSEHGDDPDFWAGDIGASKLLVPAIHALQAIPPRDGDDDGDGVLSSLLQHAGLIVVSALKARFLFNAADGAPLRDRFVALLPSLFGTELSATGWQLELWATVVAALHIGPGCDDVDDLVVVAVRELMGRAGIGSAREAVELCQRILWFDIVVPDRLKHFFARVDFGGEGSGLTS